MQYAEFKVPGDLRPHLQCVWRLRDASPSRHPQTIYPDGRCELIVHLATPMWMFELDRDWRQQAPVLFAGQLRSAIRLAARDALDCVGVRLKPAASACAVEQPPSVFRDQVVDLGRLDSDFSTRFAAAAESFASDPGTPVLWELLAARLLGKPVCRRLESAVARLESDQGSTRIEALAAAENMSLRSFQTQFTNAVGLGPKQFARIVRLQATIRALDSGDASLADLAYAGGYADQAHATRELSRFTGLTPARLRAALKERRADEATIRLAAAFVRGRG